MKIFTGRRNCALLFLFAALFSGSLSAQTCELAISGNDQLEYNESELVVPSDCTELTLTLEHEGAMEVEQMGHNWVLTESEHWRDVAESGQTAGLENDYLPPDDERVIVHTEMIGGGETTTVTFDVSELDADTDYTFFCSFPGHWAVMNGTFVIQSS